MNTEVLLISASDVYILGGGLAISMEILNVIFH